MKKEIFKKEYPKCFDLLKKSKFNISILEPKNFLKLDKFFELYNIEFFECGSDNSCTIMPYGFKGSKARAMVGLDDKDVHIGPFKTREECTEQSHLIGFQLFEGTYKYPEKEIKKETILQKFINFCKLLWE